MMFVTMRHALPSQQKSAVKQETMKMKPFALAAVALILGISPTTSSAENTKDIVRSAMTELMIGKNVSSIDRYFSQPYIQHNQSVPTGLDALKGLADKAIVKNPAFKYHMVRLFADGEFGVAHGIYEGLAEVPLVAFDIFRLENGKIVEHWDNLAPVVANNPSGRTQTDGAVDIVDVDKTVANKKLVREFVETVLIDGAFDKLPVYFDGDNYLQHNSNIADGLSGLNEGLQAMAKAGVKMKITKLHKVLGEGNFVLTVSAGNISGSPTAFYDLFRVDKGKIAEHWDVISPVLAPEKAANKNGKF